jgi:nitrous oxide reductase accessory protein NosL
MLRRRFLLVLAAIPLLAGTSGFGGEAPPPAPGAKEKCPVCGMFVANFPAFLAAVRFQDGKHLYFDGPKDLFRFTLGMKRYAPSRRQEEVQAAFVKDYYSLEFIDGRTAFYVTGSDVYGPMGKELVPFGSEKNARQFMKDHAGNALLRFHEVTPEILKALQ